MAVGALSIVGESHSSELEDTSIRVDVEGCSIMSNVVGDLLLQRGGVWCESNERGDRQCAQCHTHCFCRNQLVAELLLPAVRKQGHRPGRSAGEECIPNAKVVEATGYHSSIQHFKDVCVV